LTLSNTSSFLTWSVQLIFSILFQYHISNISRCLQMSYLPTNAPISYKSYKILRKLLRASALRCHPADVRSIKAYKLQHINIGNTVPVLRCDISR
jgi:hypothetical protein